jgi:hypothetical protein
MDSDRESLLEYLGWSRSLGLSGSLCSHNSDWGNLPSIVSYPITSLLLFVHLLMVESDIILLYIQSVLGGSSMHWDPVWWLYKHLRGLPCDVRQWKVLGIAINEVSGALSMHMAPPAIRIVMVPAGVTVMLGLHNPPHSWTSTVGPSLPDFTIAPCVDSFLCYRSIRRPKSILQDSPEV